MPNGISHRTHIDWDEAYDRFQVELTAVEDLLQSLERDAGVSLTPGAIEVILLPLVEILEAGASLDMTQVGETLKKLLEAMQQAPDARDAGMTRSSWSSLRAIWARWCDIPPICGPTRTAPKGSASPPRPPPAPVAAPAAPRRPAKLER
jgi:hypothetical protein